MKKEHSKFGFKDQFGYVFGDLAGSMVNLYIDTYILTFSTYVLGISAAWMAGLFLFAENMGCYKRSFNRFSARPFYNRKIRK